MNILNINNLCYYLEEIGIIDENSLNQFLSLYTFVINKSSLNKNINISGELSHNIFENILCAYLKKIFNVEKNYKIFSNKIINKFKQHFMIKHYNGLILLFSILSKKLNSFKILSYFKIKNKTSHISPINFKTNNNIIHSNSNSNINTSLIKSDEKIISLNSFRAKYLKNKKNEKNSDIFNKSLDFIKIKNNNTIPSIDLRNSNSIYSNNKNIQLEFTKKQFLSKIKREHIVKFKRDNSYNNKKIKNNNSINNFESKILNNFSPRFNNKKNDSKNKIQNIIQKENSNERKNNTFYNNFNLNIKNVNDTEEESLNSYIPDLLRGAFSTKSENNNFNSFFDVSPSYNNMNTISNSNFKFDKKDNVGYIIKKNVRNNIKNNLLRINNDNNLSFNDIQRIKQKLESLNNFN